MPVEDQSLRKQYEQLNEKHPDWVVWDPWWKIYYDAYTGAPDVFKYVRKHAREHNQSYADRKERAYYLNYSEAVVNLGPSFVFARDITRTTNPPEPPKFPEAKDILPKPQPGGMQQQPAVDPAKDEQPSVDPDKPPPPDAEEAEEGPEENPLIVPTVEPEYTVAPPPKPEDEDYEKFWEDTDRTGRAIDDFMNEAARFARVFGRVDILVDMPQASRPIASEQDRMDDRLEPYAVLYFPWDVINWEIDEFGKYRWVRVKQLDFTLNDPFGSRKPRPDEVFTTWTPSEWIRHRVTFNAQSGIETISKEQGPHPCEQVPIVSLYHTRIRRSVIGVALLRDIAPVNLAVLNWSSLIDEQIFGQCIAVLTMPRPRDDSKDIDLGVHNVLEYDGDTPPAYLAPPTDPAEHIAKQIERARDEIYRMGKFGSQRGTEEPSAAKSGVAYSFEFNETEQALVELANALEIAEVQMAELVGLWLGKEWEGVIDYPNEFGVDQVADEVEIVKNAKAEVRSPTFKRELEKRLSRKMSTQLPADVRRQVEYEIDTMDEPIPPPTFGF